MKRLLVIAWLAASSGVYAQPPGPRAVPPRPRDDGARMIEAYVLSNLQESLELSDEQFVKVLPLIKKLQGDRREYAQGRMRHIRQMRRGLESGGATEPQIAELLKELKALDAEGPARNRRNLDAVDAVLTPLQQAKLRVFEVEVERKLREMLAQIRRPRNPGRSGNEPPLEEP